MIVLSNTNVQTLQPGQAVVFDTVVLKTGDCESHRRNTGAVTLNKKCAVFEVSYGANINGATAASPVQLSIQLGGVTLPETTAQSAASGFNDISRTTLVKNCNDGYNRITLVNTGTIPVVVNANSVLVVKVA